MLEPLIETHDLKVIHDTNGEQINIIDGVNISIYPGERIGLVGESGSGKSILCRILAGMTPPIKNLQISGEVLVGSVDLLRASEAQLLRIRKQGFCSMIFQDPLQYLNPTMKIGRQIEEALSEKTSTRYRKGIVQELLQAVGLGEIRDIGKNYPHELSGGMRQRVLIAIALANSPRLLLADEPTTALDLSVQLGILNTIDRIQKKTNMALMLVTHDLSIIAEMCNRVYVMRRGIIVEEGEVTDVFSNPRHPYTSRLLLDSLE